MSHGQSIANAEREDESVVFVETLMLRSNTIFHSTLQFHLTSNPTLTPHPYGFPDCGHYRSPQRRQVDAL